MLERAPNPAINRAAQTLLDLRETWENTTQEERKDLVHVMIQEVGVDMEAKCILWVRARPDYEPLFSILRSLRLDGEKHYWIDPREPEGDISDIEADNVQMSTGVEILLPMSHNTLTNNRGVYRMIGMRLKSEIAQRELSDLGRRSLAP